MNRVVVVWGAAALVVAWAWRAPAAAGASSLWATQASNSTSIVVYPINVATGAAGAQAAIGSGLLFSAVNDLASDPVRHPSVLWGVRTTSAGNELISFSPYSSDILSKKLLSIGVGETITSLAIDPTDGAMYGVTSSALYRIARDTGATTSMGYLPTDYPALGFDAAGTLFAAKGKSLVTINKAIGGETAVGSGSATPNDIAARPEDGVMFGAGLDSDYQLFHVSLATAATTSLGLSLTRPSGLAFTGPPRLPADFDGNGRVDGDDFARWEENLGRRGDATVAEGDADGDLDVDFQDLMAWQRQLGGELGSARGVPEPGCAVLAAVGAMGWQARRRGARKRGAGSALAG